MTVRQPCKPANHLEAPKSDGYLTVDEEGRLVTDLAASVDLRRFDGLIAPAWNHCGRHTSRGIEFTAFVAPRCTGSQRPDNPPRRPDDGSRLTIDVGEPPNSIGGINGRGGVACICEHRLLFRPDGGSGNGLAKSRS